MEKLAFKRDPKECKTQNGNRKQKQKQDFNKQTFPNARPLSIAAQFLQNISASVINYRIMVNLHENNQQSYDFL
jgi:ATP/ADP translocase